MATYTAHTSHSSIGQSPIYKLAAQNLPAAKREARRLLGDGFRGHAILICEAIAGQRLEVAMATIGQPGWMHVQ